MDTQQQSPLVSPTQNIYKTLNEAYEFFNKEYFDNKLPPCLITLQRKSKARGYFCAERFELRASENPTVHEIALNPKYFKDRTDEDILSTLLHEMVHLWQEHNGTAPRKNYHNKEWAKKMETVGLIPSNTGEAGGRKTGQSMTHYIDVNGSYVGRIAVFLQGKKVINYQDRPTITMVRSRSKNKVKYTCPKCGLNAWGKEEIKITCGTDNIAMQQS